LLEEGRFPFQPRFSIVTYTDVLPYATLLDDMNFREI
jgi:hypothetical protein